MVLRKKEGRIEIWYIILALSPVHVLMIEWTTDPASWEEKKNMHEVGMFIEVKLVIKFIFWSKLLLIL